MGESEDLKSKREKMKRERREKIASIKKRLSDRAAAREKTKGGDE